VTQGEGKRGGSGTRRGEKSAWQFRPVVLAYALGITASVTGWGYLVFTAIDFGGSAREGTPHAWWWLGAATFGAALCLFVGLSLVSRLTRALGLTSPPAEATSHARETAPKRARTTAPDPMHLTPPADAPPATPAAVLTGELDLSHLTSRPEFQPRKAPGRHASE
jgi:hypothetical protein